MLKLKRPSRPASPAVQRKLAGASQPPRPELLPPTMRRAAPAAARPVLLKRAPATRRRTAQAMMMANPITACTGLLVVSWNRAPHDGRGTRTFGIGVLIDDRHVLTCAHNVVDSDNNRLTGALAVSATFYPGVTDAVPQQGGLAAACSFYHSGYADDSRRWDIALVRLAEPIANEVIASYPALAGEGALARQAPRASHSGMFQDLNIKMTIHGYKIPQKSITVTELTAERNALVHNGGAIKGASGSPIYQGSTICGIHTSEGRQSFGVGLFDPILQWIRDITFLVKTRAEFVTGLPQ
jgi:V8-like Glu-specific endopeptidase